MLVLSRYNVVPFLFYNLCMEQIKLTDEIIKSQLMHYMGYSATQAEMLIEMYRQNGELEDLVVIAEMKEEACSQL